VTIDGTTITWLVVGALILSLLAVVLDRVNFPQKPFRARQIVSDGSRAPRDRTGAHIVDGDEEGEGGDEASDADADEAQLGGTIRGDGYNGQPLSPWNGR
jgi:hypothetical protein